MTRRETREFINAHDWKFAKTMPKWPHWYVVRERCRNDDEFLAMVRLIRTWGYDDMFGKMKLRYIDFEGYKYWTMGCTENVTCIINRAQIKEDIEETIWVRNKDVFVAKITSDPEAAKAGGEAYLKELERREKKQNENIQKRVRPRGV